MGSGVSGLYEGTYGSVEGNGLADVALRNDRSVAQDVERWSQPHSTSYGVVDDMVAHDLDRGIYSEKNGYSNNPTAQNAFHSLVNGVLVEAGGRAMDGHYIYAVSTGGDLIIGKRNGNGKDGRPTPHPTLIGGKDPQVKIAGIVTISEGKIVKYDNESGHFKPNALSMSAANEAFSLLPDTAFHKNFKNNMEKR